MSRFALGVLFLSCVTALPAWGPEGHSLVGRIAETLLTPAARARVTAILAPGETLASIASWADDIRRTRRETAPWHYVDIPIAERHLNMARDCPKDECIVAKIADLRRTLMNPATPSDQMREALMFLVHFIGDLHQPLHCSDNHDQGGNGVHVTFADRQTNLHTVWDSALLGRQAPADELFPTLSGEAAHRRKKWAKGTVEQWAEESHHEAQKIVYGHLPKPAAGASIVIDASYEKIADPLIREQIVKAGVRLAAILNETFR